MLANLTSLIWGSESTDPPVPETSLASPNGLDTSAKFSIRAATPADEEEADWLLVDRAEVGEASGGEGQVLQLNASISATSTTTATTTTTTSITSNTTSNIKSTPASSIPPVPTISGGDLNDGAPGWLVTPPPCFTRSQVAPLTTSPLENLLIEHPSMSVYLPRPTYTSTASARIFPHRAVSDLRSPPSASPSSQPATAEREESPMREDDGGEGDGQAVEVIAARTGVTHRSPRLLQAIDVLRPAQKAQRRREERRLKRKPLNRSNKARQVAAEGNKRAKRCDMMAPGKFSRAVNNRKC